MKPLNLTIPAEITLETRKQARAFHEVLELANRIRRTGKEITEAMERMQNELQAGRPPQDHHLPSALNRIAAEQAKLETAVRFAVMLDLSSETLELAIQAGSIGEWIDVDVKDMTA